MKTRYWTIPLLASALVGNATAQTAAQGQKPTTPDLQKVDFAALDIDANGRLLKPEIVSIPMLEASFDKLDSDRDGALSPSEFAQWDRAGKTSLRPRDPATVPGGSAGAQHMPPTR